MTDNSKILVRNARDQDLPAVVEIATEAFTPYGTAENPETFQLRLRAFPDGFIILVADNEIAAYGCSEKRFAWYSCHATDCTSRTAGLIIKLYPTRISFTRFLFKSRLSIFQPAFDHARKLI